jgi:purine-binding chemotaxis protein CheW
MEKRVKQTGSQIVSFYLNNEMYGIDIRFINEIYPVKNLTHVPRANIQVQGLINIRGQVVLVLDIFAKFDRSPRILTATSQVMILKSCYELRKIFQDAPEEKFAGFGDKPVGFLVDKVGDVIDTSQIKLEPPPTHLNQAHRQLIEGVLQINDELLLLLNAAEILVPLT